MRAAHDSSEPRTPPHQVSRSNWSFTVTPPLRRVGTAAHRASSPKLGSQRPRSKSFVVVRAGLVGTPPLRATRHIARRDEWSFRRRPDAAARERARLGYGYGRRPDR